MHTMHSSLKALAFVAFLANMSVAAFTNTSAFTKSSDDKAHIDPQERGLPAPGDKPEFDYNFNIVFKGGKCTASQQATILDTMAKTAGLCDRVTFWETDVFHDWQPEVQYWMGDRPQSQLAWIKSNATLCLVMKLVVDITARQFPQSEHGR